MQYIQAIFYFFIFAIPFGTRKLVFQFTEGFHEYEAVFIYGTDIITLILFAIYFYHKIKNQKSKIKITDKNLKLFLISSLVLAGVSIFFAYSTWLALYNFLRLLILVLFACVTAGLIKKEIIRPDYIFMALAGSGIFQAIAGIMQFIKQGSVGLVWLGESFLNTETAGVAKIAVEGSRYLRAYGTMPHPNVLGAFLVLGLLALGFLWLVSSPLKRGRIKVGDIFVICGIFIVVLGLILTFSRSAWLTGVLAMLTLTCRGFMNRAARPRVLALLFIFSASVAFAIAPIRGLVFARADIAVDEPAVTARATYNDLALELIKNNPWGVGLGNQVLYSVKTGLYQKFGMDKVWQWQPIHNLYLLIASELGVTGFIIFAAFLFSLLIPNSQFLISKQFPISNDQTKAVTLIMFLALLTLGLFDHYLWTLQPGRLMLWLVLGMVMGLNVAFMTSSRLR